LHLIDGLIKDNLRMVIY